MTGTSNLHRIFFTLVLNSALFAVAAEAPGGSAGQPQPDSGMTATAAVTVTDSETSTLPAIKAEEEIMATEPPLPAADRLTSDAPEPAAPVAMTDREIQYLKDAGAVVDGATAEFASIASMEIAAANDPTDRSLHILGAAINPGESRRLHWMAGETLYGGTLDTPIYVIHGKKPGTRLCLTAAIHGDELNGVEIVRSLMESIQGGELSGTIIGVPIVNLLGFTRGTRYLPDRRDLNRYFPGNPKGSSASRIAYSFFEQIIRHCDRLVDLHTGSLNRTNLPQLRADLEIPEVLEFTGKFGSTAVLHSRNVRGNLRNAAVRAGIPAVTFELGEPGTLQQNNIDYGVRAIETLLDKLGMIKRRRSWSEPQPVYYSSRWVRVNNGGLLQSEIKVGARVKQGTTLGAIVNPLTSEIFNITSPYEGRVLGMSLNQFMLPGYAAFHIGIATEDTEALWLPLALECDWENPNEFLEEGTECSSWDVSMEYMGNNGTGDAEGNGDEGPADFLPENIQAEELELH